MPSPLPHASHNLRNLQLRMVLLTYIAYFFYYFGRKYFGIITPTLVEEGILTKNQIGLIQTGYLSVYAIGQFVSGALGDKHGPKKLIFCGMLCSGLAAIAIGLFPVFGVIFIVYSLNGLAQSTGWSNNCKLISAWIPHSKRGRVMGFWMTCYIGGSLGANTLAGYLVGENYSWKHAVFIHGAILILVGIVQGLFLINTPEDKNHQIERRSRHESSSTKKQSSFVRMLTHPVILMYGAAYFSLKFVRYTFFTWLPLYLVETKGFAKDISAYASNGFEAGGFLGLLLGGVIADKLFVKNRGRLAWLALIGMTVGLFAFRGLAQGGLWMVVLGLALVGFFLYIADSLVSGTAAQDVGGAENSGSATGIVNGIGSLGGILSGILPIWIQQRYGWDAVFILFILLSISAILILTPAAKRKEIRKS
ncbi:MFS transporter [Verrucomicrobiaceae bacterium N1E253]|uniref:MFS transporter n=1 Tax=Oceaniferula marina TaxID=2748318 RepID=A0A851GQK2_9BACT|nr:MFS transporter [Oceaniferula marina]NWK57385.1 MFS transporter [Oceaniferula marina]